MLDLFIESVFGLGYLGFFFYMIIVGTFIPLPTQLILLPAGYLISQGKLDFTTTVLVTALGTTLGASINYFMANYISRKFIGRSKIRKVRKFFNKYGKLSVLFAPLIIGLGQYISLPAGMARMPLQWFLPLVFVSNATWNFGMLMLGYLFGQDASSEVFYMTLGGMVLVISVMSTLVYRELKSY
ncbi:MAG TPA: DedA family protein [Campylobacterales bacterium]|nr:DedA family protein [Campylobacterales bacterium]